ncbi:MAG: hypothetical protein SOU05_05525 [Atopobium sp.]|uniref:hypothetical protein n=1 Tax=Atopobium sp. TaxID=1872650 RepID=UPI002A7575CD|nr:hypothetical protein [Atopobium sp.]MDY2788846.1 hypothetical protein [Atopobium sp.]
MDNTARTMDTMRDIDKFEGKLDPSREQQDVFGLEDPEGSWFFSAPKEFDVSKLSDDERKSRMNLIGTLSNAFGEVATEDSGRTEIANAVRTAYGMQSTESDAVTHTVEVNNSADKTGVLAGNNGVLISGGVSTTNGTPTANSMPATGGAPISYFDAIARTAATSNADDSISMDSMTSTASASEKTGTDAGAPMSDFSAPTFDRDEISFSGLVDTQGQPTIDLQSVLKRSVFGGYSQSSVHDLIDEISNSDAQMRAGFERQIQDLSREVASSTSECKLLRSQMEQIEDRRAKLEASLSDASAQLEDAREQSRDKIEQLAAVRSQLEQAMDMKSKLEQGVMELEAHERDAAAQIDQLKDELGRVSSELNRVSEERDTAMGRLEEMSANMGERASLLRDAQDKNSELEQQIEALTSELSAAQEQVAGHAELIEKVEQTVRECAELSDHIEELSQTNAALVGQNNALAALCQDFENERTALVSRTTAAENSAARAQDEAARAQAEAAAAQQETVRAQAEASAAQQEAAAARQEAARAQQEAVAAGQVAAEYEAAHKAIQHRCDELAVTLDAVHKQYEALLADMAKTRSDNEKLTKALSEAQAMNNHLSAAFTKSYQVISTLMGEFDTVCAYANHAVSNTAVTAEPIVSNYEPTASAAKASTLDDTAEDDATNNAAKHFCGMYDSANQGESVHAEAPSLMLVDEKPAEPVSHTLSAEEYLRQRNSDH